MSYTADTPFVSPPRISLAGWLRVLRDAGSLSSVPLWRGLTDRFPTTEAAARALYAFIVARGHDPLVWLAVGHREHRHGTATDSVLWRNDTRSWTNARTVRDPAIRPRATTITDPVRGTDYVKYADVFDSVQDGMYRITDPSYRYVREGRTTIGGVFGIWTEDPGPYTTSVIAFMNAHADLSGEEPPMPTPTRVVRVALAAGHRNTSGGDAHETEQTAQLTPRIAVACRALGMDVRVITPDDGRGMFPGTLSEAARRVVEWHAAGWPADVYLEVHTEGNGAGDRGRGAFAIYPDWGDDVDADVRDRLGPDLVRRLRDATGLPLRGNGIMSERQTGVGSQGHRLGVFGATAPIKATCTRLIVEYGSHTAPSDLAIWARPDFLDNAARATAAAIAAFAGVAPQPQPQPQPEPQPQLPPRPAWVTDPDARYWPETGQWTQWAFNGRVNELGPLALLALGLPIGPETRAIVDGVERTVQPFERGWLGWYPEDQPPWHARHLTIDEVMAILEPEAA